MKNTLEFKVFEGESVKIEWTFGNIEIDLYGVTLIIKHCTKCKLTVGDDDTPEVSTGMSICSPKDKYTRSTGRKVSLQRALKASELPKLWRKDIWEQYQKESEGRW